MDKEITHYKIAELDPGSHYLVSVQLPKHMKKKCDRLAAINKLRLQFISNNIKDVTIVDGSISIYKVNK